MAVDHTMAELDSTWWDLLQKIAVTLNWSYAALWTLDANDGRKLIWKQGYFHMRSNDDANGELFYSLYSSCTFTPGVGFAGHALAHRTNSILWLTGDELTTLEFPVENQTRFLQTAGIQTVVCLPLGLSSSSFVLELGTVNRVRETEDLAHNTKKVLLHLLSSGLRLINDITAGGTRKPAVDQFRGQMRALSHSPHPSHSAPMDETLMEPATTNSLSFFPSIYGGPGEIIPKEQRQPGPNIYSEVMQPAEHEDTFAGQIARGILHGVPPQLPLLNVPQFPRSAEQLPSPGGSLPSPWASENSWLHLEPSAFQSWTSMAEATSALDVPLHGIPGTSSATSSRLDEVRDPTDEMTPLIPFSSSLDQFMAAADQQQQQGLMSTAAAGASLRGSSSRSSVSIRSQNVEDSEISSTILESYADCHISEWEEGPRGVGTGGSSSTAVPGESENYWRGGTEQSSGPSSKETSPDSNINMPPLRQGYGIHPRISPRTTISSHTHQTSLQKQPHAGPAAGTSQQQIQERLERQHSSTPEQNQQQQEDLKPGASAVDSTPRLVQFGNVLQLGNAAGQVTDALPHEHDEAAVSHMLAERRRRNKQNENFSQLKFLIPTAAKMDKASILAATIAHIHELKERVKDLELSNQSLKQQLLGANQDQSSSEGPLISTTKAKGSPTKGRLRSPPNSASPTEEDKIQATPDGDGNLKIDVRTPCRHPDTAVHIFACLKEMHLKIINANVAINDNRIHASVIVKMKRKNSAGQSAVCAEVEQALAVCLNNQT